MADRNSAFAVIRRRRHVLIVRPRGKSRWQLPGGRLKSRETPLQGARREVMEETGLSPSIVGLTGVYMRDDGSLAFVFSASLGANEEPGGPRNEIQCQRWVPADKAGRLLSKSGRVRLNEALLHPHRFGPRRISGSRLETILRLLNVG